MKNLLKIQKVILNLTDVREIRALQDSLSHQERRIEKYLALHFNIGDRVSFIARSYGRLTGQVIGTNSVTVCVMLDEEYWAKTKLWNVQSSKLRFLGKPENPSFNPFEIAPPIYDDGSRQEVSD